MESQRFWIERAFGDAKSELGMAEYQVRGWMAWHHHMAPVMMAMLFMARHRMLWQDEIPLLSCHDIKVLLAHFLPRRQEAPRFRRGNNSANAVAPRKTKGRLGKCGQKANKRYTP
jgi:hypothetical protein